MTNDELSAILKQRVESALGGVYNDQLSTARSNALKYYRGDPFGNEVDGRSQVVSRDVQETVDGMMPSLLRVFAAGDQVVKFEPQGPEDEEAAKQATEYVNWIWSQQNPGFEIFNVWFKDALLQRLGVIKIWMEDTEDTKIERYRGLGDQELQSLLGDDSEVVEQSSTEIETPMGVVALHDVAIRRTVKDKAVRITPVEPENFLSMPGTITLDESSWSGRHVACGHRMSLTVTDLIKRGFDRDRVMAVSTPFQTDLMDDSEEARTRWDDIDTTINDDSGPIDDTMREVVCVEWYDSADIDNDGVAEYCRFFLVGDSDYELFEYEEVEGHPFAALTPIIMPHRLHGTSLADLSMDVQAVKSTLVRQILDNIYLSNAPQRVVVNGQVNIDDVLTVRPGGIIRANSLDAIREVVVPFTAGATFPLLEYFDGEKENRTGVTRYNQGLDANSLNKTATGISNIMSAAQQRAELIARVFAETGVKSAFRIILRLICKYQDKPKLIRLRNKWVPMDPRGWNHRMDMSVTVGLGTGNKTEQMGHVMALMQMYDRVVQLQGGVDGPLVNIRNIYNACAKLIEAMGLKSPEPYFMDPEQQQQQPPKEPPPDPDLIKVQQTIELDKQKAAADVQLETARMQEEFKLKAAEQQANFALRERELAMKMELEREKLRVELEIATVRMQHDMQMSREGMNMKHEMAARNADA